MNVPVISLSLSLIQGEILVLFFLLGASTVVKVGCGSAAAFNKSNEIRPCSLRSTDIQAFFDCCSHEVALTKCVEGCPCQYGGYCDFIAHQCRCPPGRSGPLCRETCSIGTYGVDCVQLCTCGDGARCDTYSGLCSCHPNRSCTVCRGGLYGSTCKLPCPCDVGVACEPTTGQCQHAPISEDNQFWTDFSISEMASIALGAALIVVLVIGGALLIRSCCKQRMSQTLTLTRLPSDEPCRYAVESGNCEVCGILGASLGAVSLVVCVIQAIIMARLFKKLSQFMRRKNIYKEWSSEEKVNKYDEEAKLATPKAEVNIPPGLRELPLLTEQTLTHRSSSSHSFDSLTSSCSEEQPDLRSPTVAELKKNLELPLKIAFSKSHTLDSRRQQCTTSGNKLMTLDNIRQRAQTSITVISPKNPCSNLLTPESTIGSPDSNESPCRNPQAYLVTEIVDVNDTKKRPSVRLRQNRPNIHLTKSIQKQIQQPDAFYFTLEANKSERGGDGAEKSPSPSPLKNKDIPKMWRKVMPTLPGKALLTKKSSDENKNTCRSSYKHSSVSQLSSPDNEVHHARTALKPPARTHKAPLVKAASTSELKRGGTWSPRTLARHRMLLGGSPQTSVRGLKRARAGTLREGFQRSVSPYEPVAQQTKNRSTNSIECAEDGGCYSKLVRHPSQRRRASSVGRTDIATVLDDRPYNRLAVGL